MKLLKDIIIQIYEEVLSGKLKRFPRHFWSEEMDKESSTILVRYLLEEKYGFNEEEIKQHIGTSFLRNHKLAGMLKYIYKHDFLSLLENTYPNIKPWELKQVPNSYWRNKDNCVAATKWLIEEKLKWDEEDIKKKFNKNVFVENGFTGLLKWGWNGETLKAIQSVYPNKFKVWELQAIPNNEWTEEQGIKAIRWFIEEKMKWTDEDIKKYWRTRYLYEHGVMRVVYTVFKNSMFTTINKVYPKRFKPSDFPKGKIKD